MPQLFRFTLPVTTVPDGTGGRTTGLGDLNFFDLFPFRASKMEIAIGPQFTFPTATEPACGIGKWQAGLATILIAPQEWRIVGALLTWQHSFADDDKRPTQDNLSFQPLIIYNLPKAWICVPPPHGISIWRGATLRFRSDSAPGRSGFLRSGTTVSLFAEPQVTIAHSGMGQPQISGIRRIESAVSHPPKVAEYSQMEHLLCNEN